MNRSQMENQGISARFHTVLRTLGRVKRNRIVLLRPEAVMDSLQGHGEQTANDRLGIYISAFLGLSVCRGLFIVTKS